MFLKAIAYFVNKKIHLKPIDKGLQPLASKNPLKTYDKGLQPLASQKINSLLIIFE